LGVKPIKVFHGNSNKNTRLHHLYEIRDRKEDVVYKYGISDKVIESRDGLSSRVRDQVYQLNLTEDWNRYVGRILITGIEGRVVARKIENEYIESHIEAFGKRPRGNPERRRSRFDGNFPK